MASPGLFAADNFVHLTLIATVELSESFVAEL